MTTGQDHIFASTSTFTLHFPIDREDSTIPSIVSCLFLLFLFPLVIRFSFPRFFSVVSAFGLLTCLPSLDFSRHFCRYSCLRWTAFSSCHHPSLFLSRVHLLEQFLISSFRTFRPNIAIFTRFLVTCPFFDFFSFRCFQRLGQFVHQFILRFFWRSVGAYFLCSPFFSHDGILSIAFGFSGWYFVLSRLSCTYFLAALTPFLRRRWPTSSCRFLSASSLHHVLPSHPWSFSTSISHKVGWAMVHPAQFSHNEPNHFWNRFEGMTYFHGT